MSCHSCLEVILVWMQYVLHFSFQKHLKSYPATTTCSTVIHCLNISATSTTPSVKNRHLSDNEGFWTYLSRSTCIHAVEQCDNVLMHIVMMYKYWEDVHTWTTILCSYSTGILSGIEQLAFNTSWINSVPSRDNFSKFPSLTQTCPCDHWNHEALNPPCEILSQYS